MGFRICDRDNKPSRLYLVRHDEYMSALRVGGGLRITNLATSLDIEMDADVLFAFDRMSFFHSREKMPVTKCLQ